MIESFKDTETEKIWKGIRSKKLPSHIQQIARRKLRMINSAQNINDFRIPPANRLEKLKTDFKGMYSIRINEKWRVVFKWQTSHAHDVQIVDYH